MKRMHDHQSCDVPTGVRRRLCISGHIERLASLATRAGVEGRARYRIHAPLLYMTKAQIIRAGLDAGVDFSLTHSCYDPTKEGWACGLCDSCQLRLQGFREVGIADPIRYAGK